MLSNVCESILEGFFEVLSVRLKFSYPSSALLLVHILLLLFCPIFDFGTFHITKAQGYSFVGNVEDWFLFI
jgi:hypothetical protein